MSRLTHLVAAELGVPVDPRISAFAANIANDYGEAARAVLFYGSCLRSERLDGEMLDFYLIVSNYRAAYGKSWLATANRLIPPNVFPVSHDGLQAKVAVLSEADFRREMGETARSTSVWARFAQPSRLVWAADAEAGKLAVDTVAEAAPTLFKLTIPTMHGEARQDSVAVFRAGFELTYGAELRAERAGKGSSIVEVDPERYRRFGESILGEEPIPRAPKIYEECRKSGWQEGAAHARLRKSAQRAWRRRQRRGKLLTLLRLAKASATYTGGVDYLAWKINRHAGTQIEVRDWQRRWPLLGALVLLPRLWLRGAVR